MDVPVSVWDADRESFGCIPPQWLSGFTHPPKHSLSAGQQVFFVCFLDGSHSDRNEMGSQNSFHVNVFGGQDVEHFFLW